MSRRESEIIGLIACGLTNEDISARTYLSINTVKTYIRSAYRKLGVTRRAQAVRWGIEHGLYESRTSAGVTASAPGPRQEPARTARTG